MGGLFGCVGLEDPDVLDRMAWLLSHRGSTSWKAGTGDVLFGGRDETLQGFYAEDGLIVACSSPPLRAAKDRPLAPISGAELARHYREEGLAALDHLDGRFAVAIWNDAAKILILARDPFGVDPLFVSRGPDWIAFASEYKALLTLRQVSAEADRRAIAFFQRHGWAPPGHSFLSSVRPVLPGTALLLSKQGVHSERLRPRPRDYAPPQARVRPDALAEAVVAAVETQSYDRERTFGISLSGGVDSALIAKSLQEVMPARELHSFTVGYGPGDPEIEGARKTARALGTRHHEITVNPRDLPRLLPETVWVMEDPGGYDEYPCLHALCREARRHVDVLFSGNVSDALFAGMAAHRRLALASRLPGGRLLLSALEAAENEGRLPRTWLGRLARRLYGGGGTPPARVLGVTEAALQAHAAGEAGQAPLFHQLCRTLTAYDGRMGAQETLAAHCGLGFRMPYAEKRLIDFGLRTPDHQKVRGLAGKVVLRQAAHCLLPREVAWRKKGIQQLRYDQELSDVLDELAEDLLAAPRLRARGLLDLESVQRLRRKNRRRPYSKPAVHRLWNALATEAWARRFLDRRSELFEVLPVRTPGLAPACDAAQEPEQENAAGDARASPGLA